MNPAEFRQIRTNLGLTQVALGRALGYQGSDETVQVAIARFEDGARPIPVRTGLLMEMFNKSKQRRMK